MVLLVVFNKNLIFLIPTVLTDGCIENALIKTFDTYVYVIHSSQGW